MARSFDGSNYLTRTLANNFGSVYYYPSTFAAWIRTNDTDQNGSFLSYGRGDLSTTYSSLRINGTDFQVNIRHSNNVTFTVGTITPGQWHLCVAVFIDRYSRLGYLDGGNKTSNGVDAGGSANIFNLQRVAILARNDTTTTPYTGEVAHVAYWDERLPDAEIELLYSGGLGYDPRLIRPAKLRQYCPLFDNDHSIAYSTLPGEERLDYSPVGSPLFVNDPFLFPVQRRPAPPPIIGAAPTPKYDMFDSAIISGA